LSLLVTAARSLRVARKDDAEVATIKKLSNCSLAKPSGAMWPMHAPVESPEKRASVSYATGSPNGKWHETYG